MGIDEIDPRDDAFNGSDGILVEVHGRGVMGCSDSRDRCKRERDHRGLADKHGESPSLIGERLIIVPRQPHNVVSVAARVDFPGLFFPSSSPTQDTTQCQRIG